jgi:hypothetical protein
MRRIHGTASKRASIGGNMPPERLLRANGGQNGRILATSYFAIQA